MFRTTGPIFAAVRLDSTATEVLRRAVDIARHYKVKLYVCHVLPDLMSVRPLFPQLQLDNAFRTAEFESEIRSALAARTGAFISPDSDSCELLIKFGTEHSALIDAAEQVGAGLIVLGHGSQEHKLSGISERVVRYAHCPVLIARPSRKGCILAATDFSDPAMPAIDAAASEAIRKGKELHLIHAFDTIKFFPYPGSSDALMPAVKPEEFIVSMEGILKERLDALVRRVSAKSGILVREAADSAILDASEKLPADLVVVGTHGRSGLGRLMLGSIAEAVVRGAKCSVLVVRLKS